MRPRNYGENTTIECRQDSHEKVNKQKRRKEILEIMLAEEIPLTAMEIASILLIHGKVDRLDRNYVAPRMTEMCIDGTVEPVGKKKCRFTGKTVTAYQIREAI